MVYWSDDVPESPESMVVGTRCNFACLPAFHGSGNAILQMHGQKPKLDEGTVYIQRIFVQFRECIFEIYDRAVASA